MSIATIITMVFQAVSFIRSFFKKSKGSTDINEDKALADAIKRGDAETVAKIRERRKHYNVIIILLLMFMCSSCTYFKYRNVPLTEGIVPYQLPAGKYIDTKGQLHIEEHVRWSLSEEDLFNNTRQIKGDNTLWYKNDLNIKRIFLTFGILVIGYVLVKLRERIFK